MWDTSAMCKTHTVKQHKSAGPCFARILLLIVLLTLLTIIGRGRFIPPSLWTFTNSSTVVRLVAAWSLESYLKEKYKQFSNFWATLFSPSVNIQTMSCSTVGSPLVFRTRTPTPFNPGHFWVIFGTNQSSLKVSICIEKRFLRKSTSYGSSEQSA